VPQNATEDGSIERGVRASRLAVPREEAPLRPAPAIAGASALTLFLTDRISGVADLAIAPPAVGEMPGLSSSPPGSDGSVRRTRISMMTFERRARSCT